MADQYLQQLDRVTEAAGTDLIPISDDPSGDARLKAITAVDLIVSAAGGVPVVQDTAGDVTFAAGKVRFYTPNAHAGEIDFCTRGVQANNIVSFPRTGNRNDWLLRYRDTSGVSMGEQCSLHGLRLDSTRSTSMVQEIRDGVAESLIIGTSVVVTTAIPTQRYLTYDTLHVEIGLGVPMPHRRETSTAIREVARSTPEWIVSTDASRTGRVIHTVEDWAGSRETFREESDGSGPRIGFLGAAAVARPTVTGSWSDGTAGVSLAAAIESLGLIADNTSA